MFSQLRPTATEACELIKLLACQVALKPVNTHPGRKHTHTCACMCVCVCTHGNWPQLLTYRHCSYADWGAGGGSPREQEVTSHSEGECCFSLSCGDYMLHRPSSCIYSIYAATFTWKSLQMIKTKHTLTASIGIRRVNSSQVMLIECTWWIDHQQLIQTKQCSEKVQKTQELHLTLYRPYLARSKLMTVQLGGKNWSSSFQEKA